MRFHGWVINKPKNKIMIYYPTTGYYLGHQLFIVFLLRSGEYAHCFRYGFWIQETPFSEGYEEYFDCAAAPHSLEMLSPLRSDNKIGKKV